MWEAFRKHLDKKTRENHAHVLLLFRVNMVYTYEDISGRRGPYSQPL